MELGVYQRKTGQKLKKQSTESRINDLKEKINFGKISFYIVVFLVSKVAVFGNMIPFGAAMYASEFAKSIPWQIGGLVLAGAAVADFNVIVLLKYAVAMLIYTAVAMKFDIRKKPLVRGAVMGAAVIAAGMIPHISSGILMYDVMILVLEGVITFIGTYLFEKAKKIIFTSTSRETPGSEDIVAITALAAVAIIGAGNIELAGISVSGCLCILVSLIFAHENGAVIGAACGVTVGMVYGFYCENIVGVLGVFAFASMLAGFFSRYGKSGSALAFLLANSVVAFYAVGSGAILPGLGEMAVASLIFTVMPPRALKFFSMAGERKKSHAAKMKEFTYMNLLESADAISEVSGIYSGISENRLFGTESAVSSFFEKTARKLCEGCSLSKHCWRHEFHRTYTSFFVMLEVINKKGFVDYRDIPDELAGKCLRKDKITDVFCNMYEVFKVDRLWESRVTEGRSMVAKQMQCVAERLKRLAKESRSGMAFDMSLEGNIRTSLNENKIPASQVIVCSGGTNKIDILLNSPSADLEKIEYVVSKCADKKYKTLFHIGNRVRLFMEPDIKVKIGKAREAKDQNPYNGDSVDCTYLDGGKFLMLLSDGMGNGERAASDSRATVDIAKKLLRTGFDTDSTISIINSVLVLKSAETSFATLDMALIDLKKYEMQFYKLGAAHSFIKRGDEVKIISAASLPAGVFGKTDIDYSKVNLMNGDTVVMVSDGIIGNHSSEKLCDVISAYMGTDPQDMADKILKFAKGMHADIVSDDMTVMVAMISDKEVS